jgi:hypothetical protein
MGVSVALLTSSAAMAEPTSQESLGQLLGRAGSGERELLFWVIIAVALAMGTMLFVRLIPDGEYRNDLDDMAPDRSHLWKSPPKADWLERAEFEIAASPEHAGPVKHIPKATIRKLNGDRNNPSE